MANVMKISPKPISLTNVSAHQWEMNVKKLKISHGL